MLYLYNFYKLNASISFFFSGEQVAQKIIRKLN